MTAYQGELDVEDGDFTLQADRLIVRNGEIGFELSGNDDGGDFRVDGVAHQQADRSYVSPSLSISYADYLGSRDRAEVVFDTVSPSPQKHVCEIKGIWKQDGDTWTFSGKLGKYKSQQG